MSITITEKAHGAAIMRLLEALGNDLPGKYFSFETGNSNSAYLITGFDPATAKRIQAGIFIKISTITIHVPTCTTCTSFNTTIMYNILDNL